MFTHSKSVIAAAGLALFSAGVLAAQAIPGADAQSNRGAPVILTIDQARLIATSKAGSNVAEQLASLQEGAASEYEAEYQKFVSDVQSLQTRKTSMAEDAFNEEARKLAAREQNMPVLRQMKAKEVSLSEQQALNEILVEMRPIVQDIVDKRGATLLLDVSDVLYASTDTDITEEALRRLDAKLTEVKVEKVDLRKAAEEAAARRQQQN